MKVQLSSKQFREVELIVNDVGCEVRANYSGRGMYGATCLALTSERGLGDLVMFVQALARETDVSETLDELSDALDRVREDQLGRGVVYYWPDVSVEP